MIKIPVGETFTFENTKCVRIDDDTVLVNRGNRYFEIKVNPEFSFRELKV